MGPQERERGRRKHSAFISFSSEEGEGAAASAASAQTCRAEPGPPRPPRTACGAALERLGVTETLHGFNDVGAVVVTLHLHFPSSLCLLACLALILRLSKNTPRADLVDRH